MIIPLQDNLRIAGDERSWQIQRYKRRIDKDTGQDVGKWEPFKFYMTLKQALAEACRREIRTADACGIAECEEAASAIVQRYTELFDNSIDGGR